MVGAVDSLTRLSEVTNKDQEEGNQQTAGYGLQDPPARTQPWRGEGWET